MKQKTNKLAQFKQWILSIVGLRFLFEKALEAKIKEIDLKLTIAKNRDIKHLESVALDLLDCDVNVKNPLLILYVSKYSALSANRILNLSEFIDMENPFIINQAMIMANKGYTDTMIVESVRKANEA